MIVPRLGRVRADPLTYEVKWIFVTSSAPDVGEAFDCSKTMEDAEGGLVLDSEEPQDFGAGQEPG